MISFLRNEISILLIAVQFLTRLPLPLEIGFTEKRLASAPKYFPLVGILIGAIGALSFWCASLVFPPIISVLISTVLTCLITGGFHEDGLADTFDGIGGGQSREHALKIMKDSRIGTYGGLALGLVLALKVSTLSALSHTTIMIALITAHGLSRLSSVLVIATSKYARDQGTGKHTSDGVSKTGLTVAVLTGLLCIAALTITLSPMYALAAVIGCVLSHVIMRSFFEKKIDGYTGDTLGAVQQLSEIGIYLGLLACL